jgi:hypothetical protein
MYWSNSKQQWLKVEEMHTKHLINALRRNVIPPGDVLLDEIAARLDAKDEALSEVADTYVITVRRQS